MESRVDWTKNKTNKKRKFIKISYSSDVSVAKITKAGFLLGPKNFCGQYVDRELLWYGKEGPQNLAWDAFPCESKKDRMA